MPLINNIIKSLSSIDCGSTLLVDNTGVYNASTNPGGYGTPNPDRDTLALFLYPRIYNEDGTISDMDPATIVTSGNDAPITDDEWVIVTALDAYYPCILYRTQVWDGVVESDTGEYQYEDGEGLFRSLSDGNSTQPSVTPGSWASAEFTDATFRTHAEANALFDPVDIIVTCNIGNCSSNYTADITQAILNKTGNCSEQAKKNWEKFFILYNGALVLETQERYIEAAAVVEVLNGLCTDLNCTSC